MNVNNSASPGSGSLVPVQAPAYLPMPGSLSAAAAQESAAFPWARSLSALYRFKWIILVIAFLGTAAGVYLSRRIEPLYETNATILISSQEGRNTGPIRANELFQSASWPEVLRSFVILDRVSSTAPLFVRSTNSAYSHLFFDARPGTGLRPGGYTLRVENNGSQYRLIGPAGSVVEQGALGDSIGRSVGLLWKPDAKAVAAATPLDFYMQAPRAASVWLRDQLVSPLRQGSSVFRLTLSGDDPVVIARTLNVLSREFVATAAVLKRKNLEDMSGILKDQLDYAQRELAAAEIALEDFRVKTITLPAEGSPVAAGVEMTRDPVLRSFFDTKISLDNLRHDRAALERTLGELRQGQPSITALWMVPSVNNAQELKSALTEYGTAEARLRSLRQVYQDEEPRVKELDASVTTMRRQTIPMLLGELIQQLKQREGDLEGRIASASTELRAIPARTIEEMRLVRNVQTREHLFLTLKNRFEEARLAEASAMPDVAVLDTAVAPHTPAANTAPRLIFMAVVGSIGFALALALLLDRIDSRFRYPEQVTGEMRLTVLAAVPKLGRRRRKKASLEQAAQVVESFRTLRLSVGASIGWSPQPLSLTVSSPGPGDGKTLVTSNLALAFAQAGYRTLLIDGDIRRGTVHNVFSAERSPGLVECLHQKRVVETSLQSTSHPSLTLLASGARFRHGPELLASRALVDLFAELRPNFDVILVDSPPLGAGIDPFALCLATQNMLLVLRPGVTDRVLAKSKLEMLDRLPVRVIGAVLNDIATKGVYRYYGYTDGYHTEDTGAPSDTMEIGQLSGRR